MNTILTEDEIDTICDQVLDTNGHTCGSLIARAVEAAVLAKIANQEPVGTVISYYTESGHREWAFRPSDSAWSVPKDAKAIERGVRSCFNVYLHPAPQQKPLTDERIIEVMGDVNHSCITAVRALIAEAGAPPKLSDNALDGQLVMALAVIRELTGTQQSDNIEETINAVREAVVFAELARQEKEKQWADHAEQLVAAFDEPPEQIRGENGQSNSG